MKRGRNQRRRQGPNPNRALDSNGPDVRIRGTANQIYDKYQALARDAQSAGDRVKAENYLQHAEHYFRVIRASQPNHTIAQDNDADNEGDLAGDSEQGDSNFSENRRSDNNRGDRNQRNDRRPRPRREDQSDNGDASNDDADDEEIAAQADDNASEENSEDSVEAEAPRLRRKRRPRSNRDAASDTAEDSAKEEVVAN